MPKIQEETIELAYGNCMAAFINEVLNLLHASFRAYALSNQNLDDS